MKNLLCKLLGHTYSDLNIDSICSCYRCDKIFRITFIKWGELVSGWTEEELK